MRAFRMYLPVISVVATLVLYTVVGQTYTDATASIAASLCALYLCALSMRHAGIPRPKEWKPSQWLFSAFALVVLLATIFSGNFLNGLLEFALDMTSCGFILLMCLVSLLVSTLPRTLRQGLFIVSAFMLLFLLIYPYIRSEHLVRPSFSTTLHIESAAYEDQGGKVALIGMGPGSFIYAWQKYRPQEVVTTPFWNEDFAVGSGLLPTMAIEFGIIAALLLTLSFFSAATEECIQIFAFARSARRRVFSLVSVGVILLAFGMLICAEPSAILLTAAAIILGSCRYEDTSSLWVRPSIRKALIGMVALGMLGAFYLGVAAIFYFYAYVNIERQDFLHARSAAEYAYALYPTGQTARLLAQVFRLSGHELGNAAASQSQVGQFFHTASSYARASTEHESKNTQSWKLLGISLAEEMSLAPSKELFSESDAAFAWAHALSPSDPSVLFFQAQLYILAGQRQQAGEALKAALALRPTYVEASDLLAGVQPK